MAKMRTRRKPRCFLAYNSEILRKVMAVHRKTGQSSHGHFHMFLTAYFGYAFAEHLDAANNRPGFIRRIIDPEGCKAMPKRKPEPFIFQPPIGYFSSR